MPTAHAKRRLYDDVRAGFVKSGTTLNAWCKAHKFTRQYVEKCLKYERNGLKSKEVRVLLADASGCFYLELPHIDEAK